MSNARTQAEGFQGSGQRVKNKSGAQAQREAEQTVSNARAQARALLAGAAAQAQSQQSQQQQQQPRVGRFQSLPSGGLSVRAPASSRYLPAACRCVPPLPVATCRRPFGACPRFQSLPAGGLSVRAPASSRCPPAASRCAPPPMHAGCSVRLGPSGEGLWGLAHHGALQQAVVMCILAGGTPGGIPAFIKLSTKTGPTLSP